MAPGVVPGDLALQEFQAFREGYERAETAAGGAVERWFRIGGYPLVLRFAGSHFGGALTDAFEHLADPPQPVPALTVLLWDSATSGVDLPHGVGSLEDHLERGLPATRPRGTVLAAYQRPDAALSMLEPERDLAIYWVPDARRVPWNDRGGPLRGILNWWMGAHGRQFVHGAAIGTRTGGVLIVGKSGSGKSTTALTCVEAGMAYAGDDYALVELEPPYVHSLHSSAKLHAHNFERVPHLASLASNAGRVGFEKAIFHLNQLYPAQMVRGFPLRAVLVPSVAERQEPSLSPLSPAAALAGLAPSTLLQLPGAQPEALRTMATLVKRVPCFRLDLGANLSALPPLLLGLLERLEKGEGTPP